MCSWKRDLGICKNWSRVVVSFLFDVLMLEMHWKIVAHYWCYYAWHFSYLLRRVDVAVAIGFALLSFMLLVSSLMTLYLRRFWLFSVVVCFSIFLLARLRLSRQTLARKRERRLPLSIWAFILVVAHMMYTSKQGLISWLLVNLVFDGHSWCSQYSSRAQLFPASLR